MISIKKFFSVLVVALFISTILFFYQGIYFPNNKILHSKTFSIKKGDGLFDIAMNLEKDDLIKNRIFFIIYILLKGNYNHLQAGVYELNSLMNIPQIGNIIVFGKSNGIKITFMEGIGIKEIDEKLLDFGSISQEKIGDYQKDYEFLKQAPYDAFLEGFLFPDTYEFSLGMKKEAIVKAFLNNFDSKLIDELREEIEVQNKNIFDIVIMASILEKEVILYSDKQKVAGILWKRMKSGMLLQADATLAYGLGKTQISNADKKSTSLYNSYKYKGLPPGPISNPGIESINAAVYFEETPYWYYLSAPDGRTIFSKTFKEHIRNINKYLR